MTIQNIPSTLSKVRSLTRCLEVRPLLQEVLFGRGCVVELMLFVISVDKVGNDGSRLEQGGSSVWILDRCIRRRSATYGYGQAKGLWKSLEVELEDGRLAAHIPGRRPLIGIDALERLLLEVIKLDPASLVGKAELFENY